MKSNHIMFTSAFSFAFDMLLIHEGGYVNDPRDPGGETKFGISDRADGRIDGKHKGKPIKTLTLEDAKQIYKEEYWDKAHCNSFDDVVAICLFDTAVNQGVDTAIKMLQRTLKVKEDGIIGPKTISAAVAQCSTLPHAFLLDRIMSYTNTKNFNIYGRGWVARAINTYYKARQFKERMNPPL